MNIKRLYNKFLLLFKTNRMRNEVLIEEYWEKDRKRKVIESKMEHY